MTHHFTLSSDVFSLLVKNALTFPDVDTCSALFLWNRDLICFQQSYWPLWVQEKSFLQSLYNPWCSPFENGPKDGPLKNYTTLLDSAGPPKVQHDLRAVFCSFEGGCLKEEMAMCRGTLSCTQCCFTLVGPLFLFCIKLAATTLKSELSSDLSSVSCPFLFWLPSDMLLGASKNIFCRIWKWQSQSAGSKNTEWNINKKQNSEWNITDIIKYFYGAEKRNQCRNHVLA